MTHPHLEGLEPMWRERMAACESIEATTAVLSCINDLNEALAALPGGGELARIGELIRTQDNRITDSPIFIVQQKRRICGMDEDYAEGFMWYDARAVESYDEAGKNERDAEREAEGLPPIQWQRGGYVDTWEFVTACFTEQGCKDYIARDGHNLREPRIYAAGSYRNQEYRDVREHLIALAALAAAPAGALWCLHLQGPDDVHAAPSRAEAEAAAKRVNDHFASHEIKPNAVAAPWPHSAEAHTESLKEWAKQWAAPAALTGACPPLADALRCVLDIGARRLLLPSEVTHWGAVLADAQRAAAPAGEDAIRAACDRYEAASDEPASFVGMQAALIDAPAAPAGARTRELLDMLASGDLSPVEQMELDNLLHDAAPAAPAEGESPSLNENRGFQAPRCEGCGGIGATEEGDPDIGSAMMECDDCHGLGITAPVAATLKDAARAPVLTLETARGLLWATGAAIERGDYSAPRVTGGRELDEPEVLRVVAKHIGRTSTIFRYICQDLAALQAATGGEG